MLARTVFSSLFTAGAIALAATVGAQAQSTWEQIETTGKVRLGCAQAEPWCFKDVTGDDAPGAVTSNGVVWRGVSVGLGQNIANALGAELEIVETTWGNAVAGLQANQFDFMFVLDATPERKEAIDFVGPMLWYPVAMLVTDDFEPKTWEQLNDPQYSFGAPTGTRFVTVLEENTPDANIVTFQQSNEVLAAFQAGRINGTTSTAPNADVARLRLGRGKTLVPTPAIGLSTEAGIRKEEDERWREFLQAEVDKNYQSGATQELYREFLAFRGLDPDTAVSTRREDW